MKEFDASGRVVGGGGGDFLTNDELLAASKLEAEATERRDRMV